MTRPHLDPEILAFETHFERVGKILSDELSTEFDNCDAREIDDIVDKIFTVPIDMVIHCPACGEQHIDADNSEEIRIKAAELGIDREGDRAYSDWLEEHEWTNPPHCSHECQFCEYTWRPADVPTNGVQAVKTKGSGDSEGLRDFLRRTRGVEGSFARAFNDLWPSNKSHLLEQRSSDLKDLHAVYLKPMSTSEHEKLIKIIHDNPGIGVIEKGPDVGKAIEAGVIKAMQREREIGRTETHRKALRHSDILLNLRNRVMALPWFNFILTKRRVLADIDECRTEIRHVDEGTIR